MAPRVRLVVAGLIATASAVVVASALATTPGRNGRIVYGAEVSGHSFID
jgi:hypothetical protein